MAQQTPIRIRDQRVSRAKLAVAKRMRQEPTPAERRLWERLRNQGLAGCKFRRQVVVAGYVADFCCLKARLIVELDGAVHATQAKEDAARTEALANLGFRVLRFSNREVSRKPDLVLTRITEALTLLNPSPRRSHGLPLSPSGEGAGG